MNFENTFEVDAPIDQVFDALMDIERVAPCAQRGVEDLAQHEDGPLDREQRFEHGGSKTFGRDPSLTLTHQQCRSRGAERESHNAHHAHGEGKKRATQWVARFTEVPAMAYSPATSRSEYHRRCRA